MENVRRMLGDMRQNGKRAARRARRTLILLLAVSALLLVGCGTEDKGTVVTGRYYNPSDGGDGEAQTEETEETAEEDSLVGTDLYLIISNDMTNEQFVLRQIASGRQFIYRYALSTSFLDKYGDSATTAEFEPGRVVRIGQKDADGKLMRVQIADEVWEYTDIVRYSVDTERGIFQIADSNYSYDEDIFVVSDGEQLSVAALDGTDEISVTGIDRRILAVSVTTGHGTLALTNTDVFEGSFIQIGTKIFAEIVPDMELDIAEGTYTVTVANNGYGGSTEIVIARGETVTLDLDELKGEGPKSGEITFIIEAEGATLKVDGEEVDYSRPVELTYGAHSLYVTADGYEDYDKKLFVGSEEAEITLELTESSETDDTESVSDTEETETDEETDSETLEDEAEELTTDYLTTLSDIISSLT